MSLTTLSLFGYHGSRRFWALAQMGLAWRRLRRVPGLRFWKLLGSGRGSGFSIHPDWSRYGLLAVWDSPAAAQAFLDRAPLMQRFREHSSEVWTVYLQPVLAHGAWSGGNPFRIDAPDEDVGPVAVLTRATLRLSRAGTFWKAVPAASVALEQAPGLLASIGVGEMPLLRQATFSFWRSVEDLKAYAYRNPAHAEVIRRTRAEGWYREELFARFRPLATRGTWNGRDPLEDMLEKQTDPSTTSPNQYLNG